MSATVYIPSSVAFTIAEFVGSGIIGTTYTKDWRQTQLSLCQAFPEFKSVVDKKLAVMDALDCNDEANPSLQARPNLQCLTVYNIWATTSCILEQGLQQWTCGGWLKELKIEGFKRDARRNPTVSKGQDGVNRSRSNLVSWVNPLRENGQNLESLCFQDCYTSDIVHSISALARLPRLKHLSLLFLNLSPVDEVRNRPFDAVSGSAGPQLESFYLKMVPRSRTHLNYNDAWYANLFQDVFGDLPSSLKEVNLIKGDQTRLDRAHWLNLPDLEVVNVEALPRGSLP